MLCSCSTADIFPSSLFLWASNHITHYYTSHLLLLVEVVVVVLVFIWYWCVFWYCDCQSNIIMFVYFSGLVCTDIKSPQVITCRWFATLRTAALYGPSLMLITNCLECASKLRSNMISQHFHVAIYNLVVYGGLKDETWGFIFSLFQIHNFSRNSLVILYIFLIVTKAMKRVFE